MFKWRVHSEGTVIEEGDWGKEVINGIGIQNIEKIELVDKNTKVTFFVQNGVIKIGQEYIHVGITKDGYPYRFSDECFFELVEIAPFTIAEYSMDTKQSKDLDRHLFVKFKVTHFIDKLTRKKLKLSAPIFKEFIIRCSEEADVSIC